MTVAEIQRALLAHSYGSCPVDGDKGKTTTDAIKAFQVATGLGANGKVAF